MVWMLAPATLAAGVTHERTAWPSLWTVQAPQAATPQPNLVPVRFSESLRTQSRGIWGSTSRETLFPLTVKFMSFGWMGLQDTLYSMLSGWLGLLLGNGEQQGLMSG